ncbi:MAG: hypothetical protein M1819_006615 [Sarea resinae]|nr:MAG: hypothetical protein M1819_006615 [Sarea resinae]
MPRIPFIGRLFLREYVALIGSFILIVLESLISIITIALPYPIIKFCYNSSRSLFNVLSSPQSRKGSKHKLSYAIANAPDFVDLCALFGYYAEEHIVQTGDGYLLGLHRLGWRKGEEALRVNSGPDGLRKKVVYLHHGLLMDSEVWVCLTEKQRCLPFQLVEMGYDVWLGNNRGNKYSKKSTKHSPTSTAFWDFSMDQFAFHDIPDSIDYVLSTTKQPSLSYIGFSQGTAQAFATLSIHPQLNDKIDVFIALAPAMAPHGLSNGIVDSLIKASPELMFLGFGRRSILGSATMWQSILYPPIFVRIIDIALSFLFAWSGSNISIHQKHAAYPHLYSFTSTKSVVHWFQIIRNASFQMYDDDVQTPLSLGGGGKYYKVAKFPTKNIKTPIVLVYGGSDSLVDIKVMLKELPKHTVAKEIPHFEHLDFLWADDVETLVFPHVFQALRTYADTASEQRYKKVEAYEDTPLDDRRKQIEAPHAPIPLPWKYPEDARQMGKVAGSSSEGTEADTEMETASLRGKKYSQVASATPGFPGGNDDESSTISNITLRKRTRIPDSTPPTSCPPLPQQTESSSTPAAHAGDENDAFAHAADAPPSPRESSTTKRHADAGTKAKAAAAAPIDPRLRRKSKSRNNSLVSKRSSDSISTTIDNAGIRVPSGRVAGGVISRGVGELE